MNKFEKALSLTTQNTSVKSNKKSNLDIFHYVLFQDDYKSRTRIVAECNYIKCELENSDFHLEEDEPDYDKYVEVFTKNHTRSKNMVDTSIAKSNNNSAYSYNPKFEDYVILKDEDGSYKSILR